MEGQKRGKDDTVLHSVLFNFVTWYSADVLGSFHPECSHTTVRRWSGPELTPNRRDRGGSAGSASALPRHLNVSPVRSVVLVCRCLSESPGFLDWLMKIGFGLKAHHRQTCVEHYSVCVDFEAPPRYMQDFTWWDEFSSRYSILLPIFFNKKPFLASFICTSVFDNKGECLWLDFRSNHSKATFSSALLHLIKLDFAH